MKRNLLLGLVALVGMLLLVAVAACNGASGPAGPTGPAGPAGPTGPAGPSAVAVSAVQPESCATCHKDQGAKHQASYDDLYQDGVIKVVDLKYSFTPNPDTTRITFKMTKNGAPFDSRQADSIGIYFVPYAGSSFEAPARLSLAGTRTYDAATGVSTSTLIEKAPGEQGYIDYKDVSQLNGLIVLYGRDETVGTLPGTRVTQNRFPFAAVVETGSGVDYVSAANVAGCEKCHTVPFLKHSYIYGQVNKDPATDFYTCKACHLDNGAGGHFEWQILVDDPDFAADYIVHGTKLSPEQEAEYAYTTRLMNDVHMSHAMEFPYPQSMSNCVVCHEGKLDMILTDANFKGETCKSCHAEDGSEERGTAELALKTLLPSPLHDSMDLRTADCASCHKEGGIAPTFRQIHAGFNGQIYVAEGQKYSDAVKVNVDSASLANNKLTIAFSATESPDVAGVDAASIRPTVLVGLYGYDTKDFLIGPHERLIDDNNDGKIDNTDKRTLEWVWGEEHPRFSGATASGGKWEVTADLSPWASLITDGKVKRVEIGVMPALKNADDVQVAMNAPSRTFNLGDNAFEDDFFSPIVKVADGCNKCHDALATTFHSPDRGGNIVVCRLCHITKAGGSHLEVQSRSIDSYTHAIHSFQGFDIGDVDFADPLEALHYEEHVGFPFPTHSITNCEACHVTGKYNVPKQSRSLPGILSGTDALEGYARQIPDLTAAVTGPASRACGGCHRAVLIKEDQGDELVSFLQHTKQGGYLIPDGTDGDNVTTILGKVIDSIMVWFK